MKKVRIIGVPEHFNLPWHMAIRENAFADRGIDLLWTDVPEGTGRMCHMLAENQADMGVILTEGCVKSISEGLPARIVQEYIGSPLLWGIHVAAASPFNSIDELQNYRPAISRMGSGSHLMAYVHASQRHWDLNQLEFVTVHNLEGAVEALTKGRAEYFMWERFTTKPLVDQGVFRRLDDCPTPWPCFVIAATQDFLKSEKGLVSHILEIINTYTSEFAGIPSIDRTIANRYGQKLDDVRQWLSLTRWSQSQLETYTVDKVQDTLLLLNLIDKKLPYENLLV